VSKDTYRFGGRGQLSESGVAGLLIIVTMGGLGRLGLIRWPFGIDAYTDWCNLKWVAPNINTRSSLGFVHMVVRSLVTYII
jgi:hypothetical protein